MKRFGLNCFNFFFYLIIALTMISGIACDSRKSQQTESDWGSDTRSQKAPPITSSVSLRPDGLPQVAGEIFGSPISIENYLFARRVHTTFKDPTDEKLTPQEMDQKIFENLIYSYEAFQRNIQVTDEELDQWIDSVLAALNLTFKRKENPQEYETWATEQLKGTVELFENQMKYMAQIEKFRREMVKEMKVQVNEDELKEDFLNVQDHVGGEYTLFDTKSEAEDFYAQYQTKKNWEKLKKEKPDLIKPFSMITLQAIIDLWGVPEEQIREFHAMELETVGKPLPFGTKWGVFRLLDKRTGDFKDFDENKRKESQMRVESRKKVAARDQWMKDLIKNANLKIFITPEMISVLQKPLEQQEKGGK